MTLRKRAVSLVLALGLLAAGAPAFAAEAPAAGEMTRTISSASEVSAAKNAAASTDVCDCYFGASADGQCVVIGENVYFDIVEYSAGENSESTQTWTYEVTAYDANKKAVTGTDVNYFETDEDIYVQTLYFNTSGMKAGTYSVELVLKDGNGAVVSKESASFRLVKQAVALNSLSLVNENNQNVTKVYVAPNAMYTYDLQFNPANTTVKRSVDAMNEGIKISNTELLSALNIGGSLVLWTGDKTGDTTVSITVAGKTATLDVCVTTDVKLLFDDVNETDWFVSHVQFAYENGIMTGTGDRTFSPNKDLTRAQIVQMLYALYGKPAVSGNMPFSDVKAGQWYYDAILWASQNNVVAGYGGGKFGPNDLVTREQLAVILCGTEPTTGELTGFADGNTVASWARNGVVRAVQNHIISGIPNKDGTLSIRPQKSATRAEAAVMIQRYIEMLQK